MLCQSQISQGQGFQSATLKDFVCSQKMTDKRDFKELLHCREVLLRGSQPDILRL